MAIFIVENNGKISYGIKRYVCKTMADIPVEVNGEEIAPGSKVYVSDEKKTYMLNTAGQWVEIKEGGGASALSDLADVDISGTIQGGKVLKYNAVEEKWVPGDDSGNVQSDWNESDTSDPSYIQNKPTIPDVSTKMDKANPTGTGSFSLNRKANTTIGTNSVAEGYDTTASGVQSHAEGGGTTASADQAHSEGGGTTASGVCAHAEGSLTTASGGQAHAEGGGTTASGAQSHAEGAGTTASGVQAHAEGTYTIAAGDSQHVSGRYNIEDNYDRYAEIVGNGTSYVRSNARTLDWQGNEILAGDLIINGNRSVANALNGIPTELSELSDVNIISTPEDGQVLSYDATSDKWIAGAPGSSGVELTQAEYDALTPEEKTNGTEYFITDGTNAPAEAASILYDNEDSGLLASDVQNAIDELNYNISNLGSDLEDLEDVNITNIQDGQIIKYNATSQTWVNADDEGGTELPVPTTADIGKSLVVESDGQGGTQYAYDINSCVELTQAAYDALTSEEKNNGSIYQISDKGYFYYKEKKFHQVKELTMAEYNQLTPAEQNNGVEYFITDAPEIVTEITLADYEELTLEEQMNGTIYQIIDCGYFFYKGNRFMASLELTLAEYNQLTLEEQMNGTEYFITDAPEMVTDLTQVEYDALTTEQKNNGSIYQISDKGYCYYKEKQFRATKELTQAQYDVLTPEQKADGTIYMISDATNNLGDLDDVTLTSPADGEVLTYDSTAQEWKNQAIPTPTVPSDIGDLNDVDILNPVSGEILIYDQANSIWYNKDLLVQNIANVDINTVVTGEILIYDGNTDKWFNSALPIPNITYSGVSAYDPATQQTTSHDFATNLGVMAIGSGGVQNWYNAGTLQDIVDHGNSFHYKIDIDNLNFGRRHLPAIAEYTRLYSTNTQIWIDVATLAGALDQMFQQPTVYTQLETTFYFANSTTAFDKLVLTANSTDTHFTFGSFTTVTDIYS